MVVMLKMLKKPVNKEVKRKDPLTQGLELLKAKSYKKSIVFLELALENNPVFAKKKLLQCFQDAYKTTANNIAVTIGQVLLNIQKTDHIFINQLGNAYRRLGEYQKSNHLYRQALKVDRSFVIALHNLAASLAKVEKYDHEIRKAIDQFKRTSGYRLPNYLHDPEIVEKLSAEYEQERIIESEKQQSLLSEKVQQLELGNTNQVKALIHRIEEMERKPIVPIYKFVCTRLRGSLKTNWAKPSIEESKQVLHKNLFNLGLYALSVGDITLAKECMLKIKKGEGQIKTLPLISALILDAEGKTELAIKQLIRELVKSPNNRLLNINLGQLYRKTGNYLLSYRYLVKAAVLLEQSEGLTDNAEIANRAKEYFEYGNDDKALSLYQVVISESPSLEAWMDMATIFIRKEQLLDAIMAINEVFELEPGYEPATQKLLEIHDQYCLKAEDRFRQGNLLEAAIFYQDALDQHLSLPTLKKLLRIYEKLEDLEKATFIRERIEQFIEKRQNVSFEADRQKLIKTGIQLMKQKKLSNAIEILEKAFSMKPDKDVFLLLSHIFKSLKHKQKLSNLLRQWHLFLKRETATQDSVNELI